MSKTSVKIIAIVIIFLDLFIWREIFAPSGGSHSFVAPASVARDYFLDVGQGDSELVIFPGGVSNDRCRTRRFRTRRPRTRTPA